MDGCENFYRGANVPSCNLPKPRKAGVKNYIRPRSAASSLPSAFFSIRET